jgi:transposase, IS30 family
MPRSFRHLDLSERVFVEAQLSLGMRPAGIAAGLKRARSTISREIRRNGWRAKLRKGAIAGGYRCVAADRRARVLAGTARRRRKLEPGNQLWMIMLEHLRKGLSPVQIASTLAPMADPVRLSHEAIYTALYAMPRGQLRASLLDLLRRRHKARRPARGKTKRSRSIPDMTLIDQRPVEVEMRLVPGHWEGDLIIGKGNLSQVGTLVERKSLFVALVKLPDGKADTVAESFTKIFKRFESQMLRSMTFDQGSEMSKHKTLTETLESLSISLIPMPLGKEASAKTSTACCANTSQRERICPCFPRTSSMTSPGHSIPDQERHSAGKLLLNCSSQKAPSTS